MCCNAGDSFCKDNCRGGAYGSCTCVKTVVFGEDYVNGKVCEWFTAQGRCLDGNLKLVYKCGVSSKAVPCEQMEYEGRESLEERNQELNVKLERAKEELIKLCGDMGKPADCFDHLDL